MIFVKASFQSNSVIYLYSVCCLYLHALENAKEYEGIGNQFLHILRDPTKVRLFSYHIAVNQLIVHKLFRGVYQHLGSSSL